MSASTDSGAPAGRGLEGADDVSRPAAAVGLVLSAAPVIAVAVWLTSTIFG